MARAGRRLRSPTTCRWISRWRCSPNSSPSAGKSRKSRRSVERRRDEAVPRDAATHTRLTPMKTLIASGFLLVALAAQSGLPPLDYSLGRDSQPQDGVPKGAVTKHVLAPGKFFPGTPHNYQIYVPAQYDA